MGVFGELLKEYRLVNGLSQRQLASLIGINSSHVSRIESARKKAPKLRTIEKIAAVLHLNNRDRKSLFEAAGYLAPPADSTQPQKEPPGFHSPLRPRRRASNLPKIQIQGLAQDAIRDVVSLLSRADLKPRQRGVLAREIIT